ncbi:protein of unknown function [Candidatus Nitrotoga arctica]|uniref:Uncharacterized protein n=1 Tax=Candidatus Nitrotoga arctica TaxID=453162 RepID=A0ABN8AJK7_9PROT|nr:protein of unknown function [Candidatus Nitrotoga arctica]
MVERQRALTISWTAFQDCHDMKSSLNPSQRRFDSTASATRSKTLHSARLHLAFILMDRIVDIIFS